MGGGAAGGDKAGRGKVSVQPVEGALRGSREEQQVEESEVKPAQAGAPRRRPRRRHEQHERDPERPADEHCP